MFGMQRNDRNAMRTIKEKPKNTTLTLMVGFLSPTTSLKDARKTGLVGESWVELL